MVDPGEGLPGSNAWHAATYASGCPTRIPTKYLAIAIATTTTTHGPPLRNEHAFAQAWLAGPEAKSCESMTMMRCTLCVVSVLASWIFDD